MKELSLDELSKRGEWLQNMAYDIIPKLGLAILILIIGFTIVKRINRLISSWFDKSKIDKSIQPFLSSIISISLKLIVIFSAVNVAGFETSSFVAVLAAAGFAIGIALQGSLANFASGILILIFKPYKVDEYIEVHGRLGKVKEIQIFNTILETFENETIVVPNKMCTDDLVINYSKLGKIKLKLSFHLPYDEDLGKVSSIVSQILEETKDVFHEPKPEHGILQFESHSMNYGVWPYCKPEDMHRLVFEINASIKAKLKQNGIRVAYSEGVEFGKY